MPVELEKVRSLFDRPEKTGDSQFMRREVASRMDERLSLVRIDPSYILDADAVIQRIRFFWQSVLTALI